MTDKEKTDLKDKMSEVVKSLILQDGEAERNKLKDLFKNNLPTLTELIEELKNGQIINVYPSGQIFARGLKFISFDTYSKFIDNLNPKQEPPSDIKQSKFTKSIRQVIWFLAAILTVYGVYELIVKYAASLF